MVSISKKEAGLIIKQLSESKDEEIKAIVNKLKSSPKKLTYIKDRRGIRKLLHQAFDEKRKVKMKYYSPHSDEHTTRIIDVYKIYINSIIAYCHLREEERTFAIERINSVAILDEKYSFPKNWNSESIILN